MFGFLTTPYLLLGAAAALLPIIIHLIRRNRAETVHFAAMRFLPATPLRLIRYQKLKQILLLLMRILALLLLGLAFARPFIIGENVPAVLGRQPRAIAIILDVSASMAAADHLPAARETAREIIRQAEKGDRLWLIAAAATTTLLAENAEPAQAEAVLAQAIQRQEAGNLREALFFADNLLGHSPLQRRAIYLISDLQASNMTTGTFVLNSNAEYHLIAVKPSWQNVALLEGQILNTTSDEMGGNLARRSRGATSRADRSNNAPGGMLVSRDAYACRVRNFSDMDQLVEVRLFFGTFAAAPVAARRISIAAGAEQVVQFSASDLVRARTFQRDPAIYFDLIAPVDDLPADNRFYLVAETEKKRRLLILSGNPESAYFVHQALQLPGSTYQSFDATPNTLSQYRLEDFDVVLMAAVAGFNRATASVLQQYVEQGGGLILSLGSSLQSEMYNHFLAEVMPGKIAGMINPADRTSDATQVLPAGVMLTGIDFGHPVFKIFVDPSNGDPAAIQASRYYRVEPDPAAIRVADFEDGGPALLERAVGKGRVLLWTTSVDLLGGNLPVRSIFVPLLYQWLNHVCRPEPPQTITHVGQPLFLGEIMTGQGRHQPVAVTFPDGSRQAFETLQPPVLTNTRQPGFYRIQLGEKASWHAVNLDVRESDPSAITAENLAARLIRSDEQAKALSGVTGIFSAPEISQRDAEKQYKLWRLGLWALLILLLGEVWLANRTPR